MNFAEDFKVVQAYVSTAWGAANNGDYINMENAHAIHVIVNTKGLTTDCTFTPELASDYAGTGSSAITGGAQFWYDADTATVDRLTKSTASTAYTLTGSANNSMVVVRYDPAQAASSNTHFTIGFSSKGTAGVGTLEATYIIESRYKGYQAVVATTSST